VTGSPPSPEPKRPVNTPASGIPAGGPGHGPARGYKWPPFEPGNTWQLRHGARSARTVAPIAGRLADGLVEAAPWTAAPAFGPTVQAWAWAEAQCVLYRAWFDERGLVDEDGEPRPGLGRWDAAERRAASLRAELGLTPQSLGQLLARAASVASAVNDQAALEALRLEGSRILAARVVQDATPALGTAAEGSVDRDTGVAVNGAQRAVGARDG
jgi:hypothetical protein